MIKIRKQVYLFKSKTAMFLHGQLPSITIRGALGYALNEEIQDNHELCNDSDKAFLFQKLFSSEQGKKGNEHLNPVRPYVIRAYFTDESKHELYCELILFGEATKFGCITQQAFARLAAKGLGRYQTKATLEVLDDQFIIPEFPQDCFELNIDFMTPIKIKENGKILTNSIPFANLIARLYERVMRLQHYCENISEKPFEFSDALVKIMGQNIESEKIFGQKKSIKRLSGRTHQVNHLDGFEGRMSYRGDFNQFREILAYLPWVHAGQGAVQGLGWTNLECISI